MTKTDPVSVLDKHDLKLDLDLAPNAIRQISDSKWCNICLVISNKNVEADNFLKKFLQRLSKLSLKTRAIVILNVTLSVSIFVVANKTVLKLQNYLKPNQNSRRVRHLSIFLAF